MLAFAGCHSKAEKESSPAPLAPPEAKAPPVSVETTNEYHGVAVVDEFRWLENGTNTKVREWSASQNQRARSYLDGLPVRALLEDRLADLLHEDAADYYSLCWRRGTLFAMKHQPPAEQPVLVRLHSYTNLASERVLFDPMKWETNGAMTVDWYVPSLDGKRIAISTSLHGTEEGTLRIIQATDGEVAPDILPRVQAATAGGSVAWNEDATGFYYTRYPRPGERPTEDLNFYQQIYFHKLGTPTEQDVYELGKDFPRIAEIQLKSSPDGRRILATVANGDGGEFAHYLREPTGGWRQIAGYDDQIKQAEFGRNPLYVEWGADPALYLLSCRQAPRGEVLRWPLAADSLTNATVVLPEGQSVLVQFKTAASGLGLVLMSGGPSQFAFFDFFDNKVRKVEERAPTAIREMIVADGDDLLFRAETYTEPYEWVHYNASRSKDRLDATPLAGSARVSFGDVEVLREKVPSKDGTLIPLNVIRKKGTQLNSKNPTLLTGYGGFGISQVPRFDVSRRPWLDAGGVFAIANLRGGGEFGQEWHRAGALTNKQNVFDDFAACAAFLIQTNYTSAERLAIRGGSNGGLLMGAALTQYPALFRAVVAQVGLYDMLRAELDANGTFNVTEYGTVARPEQFQALYAYSPYHHVLANTPYPAVLMLTGENDGRVNPAHSRKMVARMQAANSSPHPILLRTSSSGHGQGTALSESIAQQADVYAFLYDQLGVEYSQIDRGPWSGAVTPSGAVVKAKLIRDGLHAKLMLSTSQNAASGVVAASATSQAAQGNVVPFMLMGLEPNTQYFYALEINGRLEPGKSGAFRTFPAPGRASFQFVFSGDARTGSTSDVFDRIREHQPLFFMNLGDFHYLDISTNSRSRFREGYDAVLASPQQAALYRQVPFVYVWDDHDFAGNNSNRKASAHEAARFVYNEYVPHYPLPLALADRDGGPICQSFTVGRVKFIVTDLRSERDDSKKREDIGKSMMGTKQKAWFKNELLAANGRYPLICWASSVAWSGRVGTNEYYGLKTNQFGYIHHSQLRAEANIRTNQNVTPAVDDWWSAYSTERREIADFVKQNRIRGLCILHADSHMLAADDGTNSDYATGGGAPIPVMCAAPLDKEPSIKGGPYSQGVYRVRPGEGCFGLVTINDRGDAIDVDFSGRNNKDEEKITLKFSVPAFPGRTDR